MRIKQTASVILLVIIIILKTSIKIQTIHANNTRKQYTQYFHIACTVCILIHVFRIMISISIIYTYCNLQAKSFHRLEFRAPKVSKGVHLNTTTTVQYKITKSNLGNSKLFLKSKQQH